MTTTTKTSEIDYCDTCGTMIVAGVCRRCNPDIKPMSRIAAAHTSKKPHVDTREVHANGVRFASEILNNNGISSAYGIGKGIDIILHGGKTALIRAYSKKENRSFLIRRSLSDLKADFLIIVTGLGPGCTEDIYIVPIHKAKILADNSIDRNTGEDNFFINLDDCHKYIDNYDVINIVHRSI